MFANGLGRVLLCFYNGRTIKKFSSISKKDDKLIHCKRRTNVNGIFRPIYVRQPTLGSDYNKHIDGEIPKASNSTFGNCSGEGKNCPIHISVLCSTTVLLIKL